MLWATLRNAKGITLDGYGPLSHEEGAEVDHCLQDIAGGVAEILRLVPAAPHPGGRSGHASAHFGGVARAGGGRRADRGGAGR
jgi:hypothetical protein